MKQYRFMNFLLVKIYSYFLVFCLNNIICDCADEFFFFSFHAMGGRRRTPWGWGDARRNIASSQAPSSPAHAADVVVAVVPDALSYSVM